jgi:serine/threonine protein kinase
LLPADLVEDEFLARSAPPHGDHPQLADYATRFGDRPDVMARLANRCLAEQRYVKLRALGAGALAVVHEAYDRLMHRLVAIKEVCGSAAGNSRQRLLTEMQLAAELNHPGIVSIYDFGQSDQETYFVMELVSGRLLSERIGDYHAGRSARSARQSRRLLQELIECLIQMCDAVAHAHGCGILHRDLKPGNVIVSDTGEAVIVDWGLARRLKGGAKAACECNLDSMIVGTPQYMAPEQAEQQECMASDVFSLGGVLYEVLTGRPPYEWAMGSLPLDWAQVIGAAQISAPRQLAPGTSRVLDAICTKALAKSTADRYSTATELADDLRQFLHTENNARGWLSWLIPPVE